MKKEPQIKITLPSFLYFLERFNDGDISLQNNKCMKIIQSYEFYHIQENNIKQKFEERIEQNMKNSNAILINNFEVYDNDNVITYLIISFEKTLIFVEQSSISYINMLFSHYTNKPICFLSNAKEIVEKTISIQNQEITSDGTFYKEIKCLNNKFSLCKKRKISQCTYNLIWDYIISSISGYLIKKSYLRLNTNRLSEFKQREDGGGLHIIKNDDYVEFRDVGNGVSFRIVLIYHIELGELLAIKKPIDAFHNENSKLMKRELKNYSMISHPLIPKFYGITECEGYLVIEYIKGQPLDIVVNELTDDERITIIFELMMIFLYLHKNNLFYRDLKPNNVIIDDNKTAILIDFDRLLEYKPDSNEEQTLYLSSAYVAPEINYRNLSFESDIYSLGMIINFLMNRKGKINHYQTVKEIYELCINENPDERPKITTIIKKMCFSYIDNINIDHTSNVFDEFLLIILLISIIHRNSFIWEISIILKHITKEI